MHNATSTCSWNENTISFVLSIFFCGRMSHGASQRVMLQALLVQPVTLMALGGTVVSVQYWWYYLPTSKSMHPAFCAVVRLWTISTHHRLLWYLTAGLPKQGLLLGSRWCKSSLTIIVFLCVSILTLKSSLLFSVLNGHALLWSIRFSTLLSRIVCMYLWYRTSHTASGRALHLHQHPPAFLMNTALIVVRMCACNKTYWLINVCCNITLMHCIHRCCWDYPGAVWTARLLLEPCWC